MVGKDASLDDELKWIEEARAGSLEAFSQLVLLHQGRVRGYVGRHVRQMDVADDLAQEVFLDAFRNLRSYRGEVALTQWLYGVARNCVLEHLRSEARRRARESRSLGSLLLRSHLQRAEDDQGSAEEKERELSALEQCMKVLPPESARLLEEFYFEDSSAVEMAQRRQWKDTRIRKALLRIRQALRDCMDRKLAPEARA
jgi:RNA polymerase sigma-70 factor (ECF subfamily)